MEREVKTYHQPRHPLYLREGDEYQKDIDVVLALCYYCKDTYIPVPAEEYSMWVVYDCGCRPKPWWRRIFG